MVATVVVGLRGNPTASLPLFGPTHVTFAATSIFLTSLCPKSTMGRTTSKKIIHANLAAAVSLPFDPLNHLLKFFIQINSQGSHSGPNPVANPASLPSAAASPSSGPDPTIFRIAAPGPSTTPEVTGSLSDRARSLRIRKVSFSYFFYLAFIIQLS
jgi:hypothetical protein